MRSIFMFAALALLGSIIAASLGQAYAAIPDTTRVEGKTTKDYIQFTKKSKKAKKANLETQRTPT